MVSMASHFTTSFMPAEATVVKRQPFQGALKRCIQIAAGVDIIFFVLFHCIGLPVLAWVSVMSAVLYGFAYFRLLEGNGRLAMALIWTEVIGRVALGTIVIGWESGFHYYLLIFVPAIFFTAAARWAAKAGMALWLLYVGFDYAMQSFPPLAVLHHDALLTVRFFNISVVFLVLA